MAICLVLLVAHVGHHVAIPILLLLLLWLLLLLLLLLVSLLYRHRRQPVVGLPRRLRAPVVMVVHGGGIGDTNIERHLRGLGQDPSQRGKQGSMVDRMGYRPSLLCQFVIGSVVFLLSWSLARRCGRGRCWCRGPFFGSVVEVMT